MFEIRISVGVCGSGAISCVTVRPEQMERHFECFFNFAVAPESETEEGGKAGYYGLVTVLTSCSCSSFRFMREDIKS